MKDNRILPLIAMVALLVGIVTAYFTIPLQIHTSATNDGDTARLRLHCPDQRWTPVRVLGLENIRTIAFQEGYLVALDSSGQRWSYFAQPATSCETQAVAMGPVRHGVNDVSPPEGMSRIVSSAGGGVGLSINGTLVTWRTADGQPVCAAGLTGSDCGGFAGRTYTDISDVAQGASHLLMVTRDGGVLSVGMNDCGQLGRTGRNSPSGALLVGPVPGLADVVAVAAGKRSSMALGRDGRVWTWGNLSHPLVGSSTPSQPTEYALYCGPFHNPFGLPEAADTTPAVVAGLPPVVAISSFHGFDLALDRKGHVWGWGYNDCGQIGGDPRTLVHTAGFQASPRMIGGLPAVRAIAAGRRHALFLGKDGSVWVTGDNEFGQLAMRGGLPSNVAICLSSTRRAGVDGYSEKPRRVEGIGSAVAVAAGSGHSAAVDSNGHVWLWGRYP